MEQRNNNSAARFLTVGELAELLQVPESWIYARTATNDIPHVRVGRYVRFKRSEVFAWLAARQ